MNIAVTFLYQSGLWLPDTDAKKLSKWLYSFLGHYACLAKWSGEAGRKRFPIYPKAHMLSHAALELSRGAARASWVMSPLATSCQQQEDFIGKPSKVSRMTNIRQTHRSVLWRSLIKVQTCLKAAMVDDRGMDGYRGLA